jgi:hypothetical protein
MNGPEMDEMRDGDGDRREKKKKKTTRADSDVRKELKDKMERWLFVPRRWIAEMMIGVQRQVYRHARKSLLETSPTTTTEFALVGLAGVTKLEHCDPSLTTT